MSKRYRIGVFYGDVFNYNIFFNERRERTQESFDLIPTTNRRLPDATVHTQTLPQKKMWSLHWGLPRPRLSAWLYPRIVEMLGSYRYVPWAKWVGKAALLSFYVVVCSDHRLPADFSGTTKSMNLKKDANASMLNSIDF